MTINEDSGTSFDRLQNLKQQALVWANWLEKMEALDTKRDAFLVDTAGYMDTVKAVLDGLDNVENDHAKLVIEFALMGLQSRHEMEKGRRHIEELREEIASLSDEL